MSFPLFSSHEIETLVHPAVLEAARRLIDNNNGPTTLQMVGTDIIAAFAGKTSCTVVISRKPGRPTESVCTCAFGYGSACEHIAATMLSANAGEAIQTGLDLEPSRSSMPASSPEPSQQSPGGSGPVEKIEPDMEIETITGIPHPRLYLSETDGRLFAELRFDYCNGTVEISGSDRSREKLVGSSSGKVLRLERSLARELQWSAKLQESGLVSYRAGVYTPRDDQAEWVRSSLSALAAEGFAVFGRETLVACRTKQAKPSMKLSVSLAQNGFIECEISTEFNGTTADLGAIFDAIVAGKKYVRLSDGTNGEIPQEWIDKLAVVFALCEGKPKKNRLALRTSSAAVLKSLESISADTTWNETCGSGLARLVEYRGCATAVVPHAFRGQLRPYQQAGYEWMRFLREFGLGGCLADDMGLGKTVQALCMLLCEKERMAEPRTSLLVVPTSLVFNWQREARRFCPSLLVMNYHGQDRKRYRNGDMAMADVVLTTYGTVQRETEMFARMTFNYIIIDEAQAIKNPLSRTAKSVRQLSSRHRLALSGTPVENSLSELWSLFAFINPGMLGPYSRYAATFIRPIENERSGPRVAVLRDLTRPCMLRRTKGQVAKELPPKTEVLLKMPLLPRQRVLYDMTKDACRARIMEVIDTQGMERGRMHVLQALTRLRQICCHPRLVDPAFRGDSCKFEALRDLVDTIVAEKHKALLFSPFVAALDLIREQLREHAIRHEYLTGATADRQKPVDAFQEDPAIPLMLISLKAGGVGLNLTAADYVILFDPWWNPAVENQAADRAYRIGQTRPVFVYKLIVQDTIEERVLELQQSKQELFDAIITTEPAIFREMKQEDLRRLFE